MGQFGNQPDFITEIKFGGGPAGYDGSDVIDICAIYWYRRRYKSYTNRRNAT